MFKKLKSNPKYGFVMLVLLSIAISLPNFSQFQVNSLADQLRANMNLTQSQFSAISTGPLLAGLLLGFIAGMLMDRFGQKVVTVSLIITAAGVLLRTFAKGYGTMYVSMIMIGCAATFVNTTTPRIMGDWFPAHKVTLLMGIVIGIGNLAMALGSGTATLFPGPTAAFRFAAFFAAIVLILWLLFSAEKKHAPEAAEAQEEHVPLLESFRTVARSRKVWLTSFFCMGLVAAIGSVSIFIPQALISRGMSNVTAGWVSMAVTLGNMTSSFLSPIIIRKFAVTKKRLCLLLFLYGICGAILEAFAWRAPFGIILIVLLFIAGFCGMGFTAFLETLPLTFCEIGRRYAGSATGLILTVQLAGSVIIPSYIVAPIAGDHYELLFIMLGILGLLPALLARFVPVDEMYAAQESADKD